MTMCSVVTKVPSQHITSLDPRPICLQLNARSPFFSLIVGKQVVMAAPAENHKLDEDKVKFIQDEIEKKMLQNEVAKEMQLTKPITKPITDEDTPHTSKHCLFYASYDN